MFKSFKYRMLIRENHLDTFGHVNNATYLQLLEEARWEFLNEQDMNLKTIHETKIGPVVLECNIKFIKELTLRQNIVIESQMLSYHKKIGVMDQRIFDEQGNLCTEAQFKFGFFDMELRKLIVPTPQLLLAFGICH